MSQSDLVEELREALQGTLLSEEERADLITSVMTGRDFLIVGPRGTAKDLVAGKIIESLEGPRFVANCSTSLRREDLFGEADPLALREFGYADDRSYIPGLLQKADGGILYLKDIENLPEKVAEALASFMDDGVIQHGTREFRVQVRIVAVASRPDLDERLLDRFQVVHLTYPQDQEEERRFIASRASCASPPPEYVSDIAARFLKRSRGHPDLEAGASTRSGIRFVENVCATRDLSGREPDEGDLYNSAFSSFGHSIRLNPFSWKTNQEITKSIFQDAVMSAGREKDPPPKRRHSGFVGRYRIPIAAAVVVALVALGAFLMIRNSIGDQPPELPSPFQKPADTEIPDGVQPQQSNVLEEVIEEIGEEPDEIQAIVDEESGSLFIETTDGEVWEVPDWQDDVEERVNPITGELEEPEVFGGVPPALVIFSMISIAFLSTFLFDYLNFGRRIRDSRFMESIRGKLGISWEPLTKLYRNISEDSSSLSGRLEGESLGNTVKEISAARDELYAERAKDKATLVDIAELVKKKPERYPSLSGLLEESRTDDGSALPPEKQLLKDLEKHLQREGLIKATKGVAFTHRVSKFLVSDVDERILKRVYDALQGVSYEELPPLPSSDIKDVRKYQRGDSYKDIAVRESIRDAIRRSRSEVDPDNLHVYEREPERREVAIQGDADVVVVLDLSGSMAYGDKLWYAKQAIVVMTIIAERYGNRVGVVGFRDLSTEVAELGADRNNAISRVANLLPRGGTNIAAGIRRAIDLLVGELDVRKGERLEAGLHPERRKQLIILTDGDATHPKPKQFAGEYARRCARLAARHGIVISVVCIGSEEDSSEFGRSYNPELATEISEIGGGGLFFVRDMRDLSAVFVAEIDRLMFKQMAASPVPTVAA